LTGTETSPYDWNCTLPATPDDFFANVYDVGNLYHFVTTARPRLHSRKRCVKIIATAFNLCVDNMKTTFKVFPKVFDVHMFP